MPYCYINQSRECLINKSRNPSCAHHDNAVGCLFRDAFDTWKQLGAYVYRSIRVRYLREQSIPGVRKKMAIMTMRANIHIYYISQYIKHCGLIIANLYDVLLIKLFWSCHAISDESSKAIKLYWYRWCFYINDFMY